MNSVQRHETPSTISNEIQMTGSLRSGAFLLVEGDSDKRVFLEFVGRDCAEIYNRRNKDMVISVVMKLQESGFDRYLALVDNDFDNRFAAQLRVSGLFYTIANDLDSEIHRTAAFGRVLRHYGSSAKLELVGTDENGVRLMLDERAARLGAMRYLSRREGLELKFRGARRRFMPRSSELDSLSQLRSLVQNSTTDLEIGDIPQVINDLESVIETEIDLSALVIGHDFVRVSGRALHYELGNIGDFDNDAGFLLLEKALRGAFALSDFYETELSNIMHDFAADLGFEEFF